MVRHIVDFYREETGLTMVEYAVAGSLITLAAAAAFSALGNAITTRILLITAAVYL
jgi:pilus assembly protein Flp/PilA